MFYFIAGIAGLMIGLYAGKRRQNGRSWCGIVSDLSVDIFGACVSAWNWVSYPFRKGEDKNHEESDVT